MEGPGLVSDNGTELASAAVLRRAIDRVAWRYIPTRQVGPECFHLIPNTRLRDECFKNTCSQAERSPRSSRRGATTTITYARIPASER